MALFALLGRISFFNTVSGSNWRSQRLLAAELLAQAESPSKFRLLAILLWSGKSHSGDSEEFVKFVPCSIRHLNLPNSMYRGYTIDLEQKGSAWFISVSPKTPDLPILRYYSTQAFLKCEAEAIAEAKSRIDRVLAV
jgi:hypothetical protein